MGMLSAARHQVCEKKTNSAQDACRLLVLLAAAVVLDSATEHMTVEQYLKHQLSVMEEKARVRFVAGLSGQLGL